jgi:hypothetical protein
VPGGGRARSGVAARGRHRRPEATSAALVGCPEADGTTKAEAAGWTVRVVVRDGETQLGTMDYRVDRVGLTVDGGVITGVQVG